MPRDPLVQDASGIVKTRDFEHFWPFLWAIVHGFLVLGEFRCPVTPVHDSSGILKFVISRISGHFRVL